MNRRVAASLVVVLAITAGCTAAAPPRSGPGATAIAMANLPWASADPGGARTAATSIDAFAVELYRRLETQDGNLVVSPTSIAVALAMARLGARGETASQMDAVLHATGGAAFAAQINALDQALASRSGVFKDPEGNDLRVELRTANAPFAQRDETWRPEFLDALATDFGAGLRLVDYKRDAEAARALINDWVAGQTEGRIPELIGEGVLDALSRLTLVNAI